MKTNPLKDGILTDNSVGIGPVTRKMILARATQLAIVDDRTAQEVSKFDLDQATRELSGEPGLDPEDAVLAATPEAERWDPVPGSTGTKILPEPGEDEDEEGRSDNERLVDEGMAGAELDQSVQAAKAAAKRDL
jgi:hypothetical protein